MASTPHLPRADRQHRCLRRSSTHTKCRTTWRSSENYGDRPSRSAMRPLHAARKPRSDFGRYWLCHDAQGPSQVAAQKLPDANVDSEVDEIRKACEIVPRIRRSRKIMSANKTGRPHRIAVAAIPQAAIIRRVVGADAQMTQTKRVIHRRRSGAATDGANASTRNDRSGPIDIDSGQWWGCYEVD